MGKIRDSFYDIYEIDKQEAEKKHRQKEQEELERRHMSLNRRISDRLANPRTEVGRTIKDNSESYLYLIPIIAVIIVVFSLAKAAGSAVVVAFLKKHIALPIFVVTWFALSPKLLGNKTDSDGGVK